MDEIHGIQTRQMKGNCRYLKRGSGEDLKFLGLKKIKQIGSSKN